MYNRESERNAHRKFHKNQTENGKVFKISGEKLWKKEDARSHMENELALEPNIANYKIL